MKKAQSKDIRVATSGPSKSARAYDESGPTETVLKRYGYATNEDGTEEMMYQFQTGAFKGGHAGEKWVNGDMRKHWGITHWVEE